MITVQTTLYTVSTKMDLEGARQAAGPFLVQTPKGVSLLLPTIKIVVVAR